MPKILLIDDDTGVLLSLRMVLEDAGHSVTAAANGQKGLALAQSDSYDLIITDLLMPDLDGLEIIRQLRKTLPNAKILAISGGGSVGPGVYLNLADKFGADLTLTKPLSKTDLLEALATILEPKSN